MKKAFTLAEVLTALAIAGVIASVTIPTLQAGYHNRKYESMTKKAHLTLQQAIDSTMLDEKIAKARADMGLMYWLVADRYEVGGSSYTKEEPSLRVLHNSTSVTSDKRIVAKLTDGMIVQDSNICDSCVGTSSCSVFVDLDGASGPTRGGWGNSETRPSASSERDIVMFECKYNTIMPPSDNTSVATRTRAYLGIDED